MAAYDPKRPRPSASTPTDDPAPVEALLEPVAPAPPVDEVSLEPTAPAAVTDETAAGESVADSAVADSAVADEAVADESVADDVSIDDSVTVGSAADGSGAELPTDGATGDRAVERFRRAAGDRSQRFVRRIGLGSADVERGAGGTGSGDGNGQSSGGDRGGGLVDRGPAVGRAALQASSPGLRHPTTHAAHRGGRARARRGGPSARPSVRIGHRAVMSEMFDPGVRVPIMTEKLPFIADP